MKLKTFLAASLAAIVVTTASVQFVSAQDDRQRGERGGRDRGGPPGGRQGGFGGGGFGGGFGGVGLRGRGQAVGDMMMVGLLAREDVRDELQLLPDQVEGLQKLNERLRPERPNFDFQNASQEERQAFTTKMQAEQAERAAEMKDNLEELLLPEQLTRLEQIAMQVAGPAALVTPEVSKKIGLSDDVVAKMTEMMESSAEAAREMANAAMRDRNFEGIREKMAEMTTELNEKLLAQLSPEQMAEYEQLKGKPFELVGGMFGRGGPGGRGGFGAGGPQRRGPGGDFGGRRGGGGRPPRN